MKLSGVTCSTELRDVLLRLKIVSTVFGKCYDEMLSFFQIDQDVARRRDVEINPNDGLKETVRVDPNSKEARVTLRDVSDKATCILPLKKLNRCQQKFNIRLLYYTGVYW